MNNLEAPIIIDPEPEILHHKIDCQQEQVSKVIEDNSANSKVTHESIRENSLMFLYKNKFTEQDLRGIYTILNEAQRYKEQFSEEEDLFNILKSFTWLADLSSLLSSEDEIILEPQNDNKISSKDNKCKLLDVLTIEVNQLITYCFQQIEHFDCSEGPNNEFELFKGTVQRGKRLTHKDVRIRELLNLCIKKLWLIEITRLKQSSELINPTTLIEIYDEAQNSSQLNLYDEWFTNLYNSYQDWITLFTISLYSRDLETLCESDEIDKAYQGTQKLLDTYPSLRVQLDYIYASVVSLNKTIKWVRKVRKCLSQTADGSKISYTIINDLLNASKELSLPPEFSHLSNLSAVVTGGSALKSLTSDFLNNVNQHCKILNSEASLRQLDSQSERFALNINNGQFQQKLLLRRRGGLYSFEDCKNLLKNLEASKICFAQEISSIKGCVGAYKSWIDQLTQLKFKYKLNCYIHLDKKTSSFIHLSDVVDVVEEVDNLKLKLEKQFLTQHNEQDLYVIEWVLAWVLLLNKQDLTNLIPIKKRYLITFKTNNKLSTWNQTLNSIEDCKEHIHSNILKPLQSSLLYKTVMTEWNKGKEYFDIITKMKLYSSQASDYLNSMEYDFVVFENIQDGLLNIKEVQQLQIHLQESSVDFSFEMKYLDEIIQSYQGVRDWINTMIGSQNPMNPPERKKYHSSVLKNTLRKLIMIPLNFRESKEDILVLNMIKASLYIKDDVQRIKEHIHDNNQAKLDFRVAQAILNKYEKSIVYDKDVEQIKQDYSNSKTSLSKIKNILHEEDHKFEDVIDCYSQFSCMQINFAEEMEQLRLWFWQYLNSWIQRHSKCKTNIHRNSAMDKYIGQPKLTYQQLNWLVQDGHILANHEDVVYNIRSDVENLDEILRSINIKISEINSTTSIEALNRIDYNTDDSITLKSEYDLRRQRIINQTFSNVLYEKTIIISDVRINREDEEQELLETILCERKDVKIKINSTVNQIKEGRFNSLIEEGVVTKKIKLESEGCSVLQMESTKIVKKENNINDEFVINNSSREKTVSQLTKLMKQNIYFTTMQNKTYHQLARKVENELYNECGGNQLQYDYLIKYYKDIFVKIKKFKNISRFLNQNGCKREIVLYLFKNIDRFPLIEGIVKQNNSQTLNDLVERTSKASLTDYSRALKPFLPQMDQNQHDSQKSNIIFKSKEINIKIISPFKGRMIEDAFKVLTNINDQDIFQLIDEINIHPVPVFVLSQAEISLKTLMAPPNYEIESRNNKDICTFLYDFSKRCPIETQHEMFDKYYEIYSGVFSFQSQALEFEERNITASLMILESTNYLSNFSSICSEGSLKMMTKLEFKKFETYIDKIKDKKPKNIKLLYGYIAAEEISIDSANHIARFLNGENRVAYCKYDKNCTIYVFHLDNLKLCWLEDSKMHSIHTCLIAGERKISTMMFVIVSKNYQSSDGRPSFKHQTLLSTNTKCNQNSIVFEDYIFEEDDIQIEDTSVNLLKYYL